MLHTSLHNLVKPYFICQSQQRDPPLRRLSFVFLAVEPGKCCSQGPQTSRSGCYRYPSLACCKDMTGKAPSSHPIQRNSSYQMYTMNSQISTPLQKSRDFLGRCEWMPSNSHQSMIRERSEKKQSPVAEHQKRRKLLEQ